jgi:hypothetical protein
MTANPALVATAVREISPVQPVLAPIEMTEMIHA